MINHVMKRWIARSVVVFVTAVSLASCAPEPENPAEALDTDQSYLQETAATWAEYYHIADPPLVTPVRYIGTEEADQVHRDCLLDAGYPANSFGMIDFPEDQKQQFDLAEFTCKMQYPLPERYTQVWSDAEISTQYAWTVQYVIPCLEREGHRVSTPPSETVFLETWRSDAFYPFKDVKIDLPGAQFNQEMTRLENLCPQIAPGSVLFDGMSISDWTATR